MGRIPIRPVTVDGELAYVPLTRGLVSVIDAVDASLIGQHNWGAHHTGYGVYARRIEKSNGQSNYIYMHRFLADPPEGYRVDHRDVNSLNNRRGNLRICLQVQNQANTKAPRHNTSGIKGVYWDKRDARWIAMISIGNKSKYLGRSKDINVAAEMYRKALSELHGEFARFE